LAIRLFYFLVFSFQATPFYIRVYTPNVCTSSCTYRVFVRVQVTSRGFEPTVVEPWAFVKAPHY